MSELTTVAPFSDGIYNVVVTMSSGTAKIQMTTEDNTAQDITDASWTANAITTISVPNCYLTAVTTGDAQVFLKRKLVN